MRKLVCKEFILDFLSDFLDGSLSPGVIADLERHLVGCAPCIAYLNTYKKTHDLTRRAARVEMPEEMKARLHVFLLKQLTKGK